MPEGRAAQENTKELKKSQYQILKQQSQEHFIFMMRKCLITEVWATYIYGMNKFSCAYIF